MFKLYIRTKLDNFKLAKDYSTYKLAVEAGADLGGYGNFYVDTGTKAPTREEQLLLDPIPRPIRATNHARELALLLD